jgi:hypothetical protein
VFNVRSFPGLFRDSLARERIRRELRGNLEILGYLLYNKTVLLIIRRLLREKEAYPEHLLPEERNP